MKRVCLYVNNIPESWFLEARYRGINLSKLFRDALQEKLQKEDSDTFRKIYKIRKTDYRFNYIEKELVRLIVFDFPFTYRAEKIIRDYIKDLDYLGYRIFLSPQEFLNFYLGILKRVIEENNLEIMPIVIEKEGSDFIKCSGCKRRISEVNSFFNIGKRKYFLLIEYNLPLCFDCYSKSVFEKTQEEREENKRKAKELMLQKINELFGDKNEKQN